jgi:hypothetical protein
MWDLRGRAMLLLLGTAAVPIAAAVAIAIVLLALFLLEEKTVDEEAIRFEAIDFGDIEGWQDDDQADAFATLLRSCRKISARPGSGNVSLGVCAAALDLASRG